MGKIYIMSAKYEIPYASLDKVKNLMEAGKVQPALHGTRLTS